MRGIDTCDDDCTSYYDNYEASNVNNYLSFVQ